MKRRKHFQTMPSSHGSIIVSKHLVRSYPVSLCEPQHNAGHNQDHFDNHLLLSVLGCFHGRILALQHEFWKNTNRPVLQHITFNKRQILSSSTDVLRTWHASLRLSLGSSVVRGESAGVSIQVRGLRVPSQVMQRTAFFGFWFEIAREVTWNM